MRRANKDDLSQLFYWRNLEDVRKYSRNTEIISLDEHQSWFETKLEDNAVCISIFLDGNQYLATTRLDFKSDNTWEVSLTVDPKFRNMGVGKAVLGKTCAFAFESLGAARLQAFVNLENISSIRLFESLGFLKYCEVEQFSLYISELS